MPWMILIAAALVAALLTRICIALCMRFSVLDRPNSRSSHDEPIPRAGGMGVVGGFLAGLAVLLIWFPQVLPPRSEAAFWVIVAAAVFASLVGILDDLFDISVAPKYLAQFAVALGAIFAGLRIEAVQLPFLGTVPLAWGAIPLTVLWITGFPNVFNFMDGINGMAAGTAAIYGAALCALAWQLGGQGFGTLALLAAAASLGFLYFNFPRARIFMGDSGSLFLGTLLALLAARVSAGPSGRGFVPALMICSVYLFDSGFTILLRLKNRENILRAHRSHLYQRLTRSGFSHALVTRSYWLLHALVAAAALGYAGASDRRRAGLLAAVAGLLGLLILLVHLREAYVARQPCEADQCPSGEPGRGRVL